MSRLEVVGAAITGPNGVLAALRSPTMSTPDVWEFPGGKVEPGESAHDALVREIREELGVSIAVGAELGVVETARIRLTVHLATVQDGVPTPREHAALRWVGPADLRSLDWAPADRPLLPALHDLLTRRDHLR
jgi:8-oxo-dGTP diphosphatase